MNRGNYAHGHGRLPLPGGGNVHLPGRDRCPDNGLAPSEVHGENPPKHRLLVDIEITHRGLHEFLAYNDKLFAGIPQLRAAFSLKVYPRRVGSRLFGALALTFLLFR
jgi:hypothetical protein